MATSETLHLSIHIPPLRERGEIHKYKSDFLPIPHITHSRSGSIGVSDGGAVEDSHGGVDHVRVEEEYHPPHSMVV